MAKKTKKKSPPLKFMKIMATLTGDAEKNATPFNMVDGIEALEVYIKDKVKRPYGNKQNRKSDKLLIKWIKSHKREYGYAPDPFLHAVVLYYIELEASSNE